MHSEPAIEIDLEMLRFLARYVTTPIKWDIVTFFAENPFTQDTAAGIARRLARLEAVVRRELEDLVLLGLLERENAGPDAIYRLGSDVELRRQLPAFARRPAQFTPPHIQ